METKKESKVEIAKRIYSDLPKNAEGRLLGVDSEGKPAGRRGFINRFMEECGVSESGANTYFYLAQLHVNPRPIPEPKPVLKMKKLVILFHKKGATPIAVIPFREDKERPANSKIQAALRAHIKTLPVENYRPAYDSHWPSTGKMYMKKPDHKMDMKAGYYTIHIVD